MPSMRILAVIRRENRRSAYALMLVLFIAGLGAILSLSYLAAHRNVLEEVSHDQLMTRASAAAELALELAIHELTTDETPACTTSDYDNEVVTVGEAQALENIWNEHWGAGGVLGVVSQYDTSATGADNVDLYAVEVQRFDDLNESGLSQFNFAPSYYKITASGYSRSGMGLGERSARHRLEAVVQIPKDSYFSNLIGDYAFSATMDPIKDPPVLAIVALDPLDETEPAVDADGQQGVPLYIGNGVHVQGSIYSRKAPKIHGYVDGHAYYEDFTLNGLPKDPVPSTLLTKDYQSLARGLMIAPTLTIQDYFDSTNHTYLIDRVRRKAQPLPDVIETVPGEEGVFTADDLTEVLGASSKSNPANVLYYTGERLIIDSVSSQISCRGTIVAKTIELRTSGTPPASGYSFHFRPAIAGFPALVCNQLRLGGPDNTHNTSFEKTLIEGPALIRQFIYSNYETDSDETDVSDYHGGAVFYGYILSNMSGTELAAAGEKGFAAQGFYHGDCNDTDCDDWNESWTGFVAALDADVNPVYLVAKDSSGFALPYRRLQLINGQSVTLQAELGRGVFPPETVRFVRMRRNEAGIRFSDEVEALWLDCIAGTLEECQN